MAELYLRGGAGRCAPEPPYPLGYTGHVPQTRQAVGQTYGRAIRDAINGGAGKHGHTQSSHALDFRHPDSAAHAHAPPARAAAAATRVGVHRHPTASDPNLLRISTAQISYPPPESEAYLRPRARDEPRAAPWAECAHTVYGV